MKKHLKEDTVKYINKYTGSHQKKRAVTSILTALALSLPLMFTACNSEQDAPVNATAAITTGKESGSGDNTSEIPVSETATSEATTTETISETEKVSQTKNEETTNTATIQDETTTISDGSTSASSDTYDFTLCFAGDISLEEGAVTTNLLDSSQNGLKDCISPELLQIMNDADYTCVNNEFTYSTRGTPTPNKTWTFRANPSRVEYLHEMGVDIVLLANNHVYDYGPDAMLDTLNTLNDAGIKYMGAGANLEEAMKPVYIEIDGVTIAYVAASRAEKYKLTPQATADSPGILRCYDPELFLQVIREADANADIVIANVHWGTERSTVLETAQLETGKQYIDAGADVIIGSHSHCLQGIEYYNGKPIIYSLGNYWFDEYTEDTMLLQLHIKGDEEKYEMEVSVVPAVHENAKTQIASTSEEKERIFSYLESISINIQIDENGVVTEEE